MDQLRRHDGSIQGLHGVVRGLGTASHKPSQQRYNGDGTDRAERYGIRPLLSSLGQYKGAEDRREIYVRAPTARSETLVVMDKTESQHRLSTRRRTHTNTRTSTRRSRFRMPSDKKSISQFYGKKKERNVTENQEQREKNEREFFQSAKFLSHFSTSFLHSLLALTLLYGL